MTRADAIEQLEKAYKECIDLGQTCGKDSVFWKRAEAIKMGLNSLKVDEMYDLAEENADDFVSRKVYEQVMWERDTAIAQLKELGYEFGEKIRTGHWKPTIVRGSESYTCSECFAECCYVTTNYCPSCGCRMVEPQEISERNMNMWEEVFKAESEEK